MGKLTFASVKSVLLSVKVTHLRQDFDRGMIDRGRMAAQCLFPIPLSMALPGMKL